ncbi:hypothetical protein [Desulfurococcus amylolyticus]|uniref:hypothetical protein n=1 Tax=Desulfurococcus amylolyticus TaxID=94694 RepID=UPI001E632887|nr:hypothetical protein [Desulfurococcus amylolyticus]
MCLSTDLDTLRRILSMRLVFEGGSGWVSRELIDVLEDYLMERLPVMINDLVEPLGLEASILSDSGCNIFPEEEACNQLVIAELYASEADKPLVYVLYRLIKGENTFEFYLYKIVEKPD